MFIDAITQNDLYTILLMIVHRKLSPEDLKSSILHFAASQGNVTIVQLLLWVNSFFFSSRNLLISLSF